MTNLIEVRVPDIGDYKDVEVIELAVQPGDTVAVDATLITLETEKATMDVPSTAAGIVRELKVSRGSRVSQGDVIAVVEGVAGARPSPQAMPAGQEKEPPLRRNARPLARPRRPRPLPGPLPRRRERG